MRVPENVLNSTAILVGSQEGASAGNYGRFPRNMSQWLCQQCGTHHRYLGSEFEKHGKSDTGRRMHKRMVRRCSSLPVWTAARRAGVEHPAPEHRETHHAEPEGFAFRFCSVDGSSRHSSHLVLEGNNQGNDHRMAHAAGISNLLKRRGLVKCFNRSRCSCLNLLSIKSITLM